VKILATYGNWSLSLHKGFLLFLLILSSHFYGSSPVQAQTTWIRGQVFDEFGEPFFGASISTPGSTMSTLSDDRGNFSLMVEEEEVELTVRALGYQVVKVFVDADTISKALLIHFQPDPKALETIEITSEKIKEGNWESAKLVKHIHQNYLLEHESTHVLKTLSKIPGVQSLSAGTSLARPMIRGMGFYRVLTAQNSMQLHGQMWNRHYGLPLDHHSVNQIKVIKGPGSLEYGSDAIGGVIDIQSFSVPDGWHAGLDFSGRTNTEWLGASAELAYGKNGFFSEINASYNSFGDFRIPTATQYLLPAPVSDIEASHAVAIEKRVPNTAGKESALHWKFGWVRDAGKSWFDLQYHSDQSGFFDWSGLQRDSIRDLHDLSARDQQHPYQSIDHLTLQHLSNQYFGKDKLEVALGLQWDRSREYGDLLDRTGQRSEDLEFFEEKGGLELELLLQSYALKSTYFLRRLGDHRLTFGLDLLYQVHEKSGFSHILPAYSNRKAGTYLHYRYDVSPKINVMAGARFDMHFFAMEETLNPDTEFGDLYFNPAFSKSFPASAFSLGFNYQPTTYTLLKMHLGKSFRVPSAYELGAYGLHRHEGRFEKGSLENEAEEAWQVDLAMEYQRGKTVLSLSPFFNCFTNYLYLKPTAELRPEGQVYAYAQNRAVISGTEFSFSYQPRKSLSIYTNLEYVYAVNLDQRSALPSTPPLRSFSGLEFHIKETGCCQKNKVGLEIMAVAAQRYTVVNELDTPGFLLFNAHASTELHWGDQPVHLQVRINNLLNTSYFDHLSFYRRLRIPEQGRDILLFIRIPLLENIKSQ
jgi:iron complex outermembrane receptor protein